MTKYFTFARYAQEYFAGDNDEKKEEVLSIVGQNLTYEDRKLLFESMKYLTPIVQKYPNLKAQYFRVGTYKKQRGEKLIADIISAWYAVVSEVRTPIASSINL